MRRVRGEVDKEEQCSKSKCEKWWICEGEETAREGKGRGREESDKEKGSI